MAAKAKQKRLTPREQAFVEAYLGPAEGDPKTAYRMSGAGQCNDATAKREATRIMARPHVAALIDEAKRAATVKLIRAQKVAATRAERQVTATADNIVAEMARIGFARLTDVVQVIDGKAVVLDTALWPEDVKAAVAEISHGPNGLRVKMHPKEPALMALGKNVGLFSEKVELTGKDGTPVNIVVRRFAPEKPEPTGG